MAAVASDATAEANRTRGELRENETRLSKREDVLERQTELLQQQEKAVKQQEQELDRRLRNAELKDKQLTTLIAQQKNQLLKITGMDMEEARQLLLKRLEDECEHDMSALIQRKVEEALRKSDERFRKVFHVSPVAIVVTTLDEGRIIDANNAYWNLAGHDPKTSIGRTTFELRRDLTPEQREMIRYWASRIPAKPVAAFALHSTV